MEIKKYKFTSSEPILKHKPVIKYASGISYPRFSYGFHHYYHQSKEKMEITKQFIGKKKVFNVYNEYEPTIDEYDNDLNKLANKFFGVNVIGVDFYKLWEIFTTFPEITSKKSMVIVHINDDDGSFTQATNLFRSKRVKGSTTKVNVKGEADLVIATGGTLKDDILELEEIDYKIKLELHEQNVVSVLLKQIEEAIKIQAKGGTFILRVYESFTEVTVKLLSILVELYKDVHIVKPFTSSPVLSEKFVVCTEFKADKNAVKTVEELVRGLNSKDILDMFPSYVVPDSVRQFFIKLNVDLAVSQFTKINQMVDFINKQNYRGETYHERREMQIEATKLWNSKFFN